MLPVGIASICIGLASPGHLHDRALAELALDLGDGQVDRAFPFCHGFHPHLGAGSASPGVCQSPHWEPIRYRKLVLFPAGIVPQTGPWVNP